MVRLLQLTCFLLIGSLFAYVTGIQYANKSDVYVLITHLLLAIGLYSSTYNIDLNTAKKHIRTILLVISVGVLLKIVMISGILFYFHQDVKYVILGVVVAQIDPLSVASILHNPKMSHRVKSILAAWSSFDDPITVLLSLYASMIITHFKSTNILHNNPHVIDYFFSFGANLVFALLAFLLWYIIRKNSILVYILLLILFFISISYFLMLGIALVGLFLRPSIDSIIPRISQFALWISALMLGLLLLDGIDMINGLWLAIVTFISHMVVSFLLTKKLPFQDRVYLAFAQQNGITAIILALMFETQFRGIVAITIPAIFFINILHVLSNWTIDQKNKQ